MQVATRADLEKFQTDALFVLVGQNPLPNYVATRLLLKEGGSLYLVHSAGKDGSGQVAQRLATQLKQYRPHLIPVDPLDRNNIQKQVRPYLERAASGSVGLNYTGGTKMMSVHVYRAVEEFGRARDREPVFSYLDADTLSLSIEPRRGQPPFQGKVVRSLDVSIKEVFDLHGISLPGQLQTEPRLPELAQALAKLHKEAAGIQAWQASRKVLADCQGHPWAQVKAEVLSAGTSPEVVAHLEQTLGLEETEAVDLAAAAQTAGLESGGQLKLWLEGVWLEDWVLTCVRDLDCEQRAQNLRAYAPGLFQIDVAVMRGYQLFAFSCGVTPDHGQAKLKFFEIYTRARQLGGDEARCALVCCANDAGGLEQEISAEWDAAKRVRVFGRHDLPSLKTGIKGWLESI